MAVGLDSISATELSVSLGNHLNTEVPATLLFDHPSVRSIENLLNNDPPAFSVYEKTIHAISPPETLDTVPIEEIISL